MKNAKILPLLLLSLFMYSCTKEKPVAVVNGEIITEKMLKYAIVERGDEQKNKGVMLDQNQLKRLAIDQLVIERLLVQGAREHKIEVSKEDVSKDIDLKIQRMGLDRFKNALKVKNISEDEYRKITSEKLQMQKFIDSMVSGDSVTDAEVKEAYLNSSTPIMKPESVFMRFIQVSTADEASAIVQGIKSHNMDFDAIADKLEKEKKAVTSDYGWASPDFFGPQIASALRNMKINGWGGPYAGKDSDFYVIKVKDRRPPGPETFDDAKGRLRAKLLAEQRQKAVTLWLGIKKDKSKIFIHE